MKNDWFFDKFDDAVENHPVRTVLTGWAIAALIGLISWAIIIAMVVIGIKLVF